MTPKRHEYPSQHATALAWYDACMFHVVLRSTLPLLMLYAAHVTAAEKKIYRPADARPKHNDQQLAAASIHRYESKRLRLYTDVDPDIAKTLPPLVDQLYDALADYFEPLPSDEKKTEFQVTGYLIRDEQLFREQKLMEGLPNLHHGKHVANRFWMREQDYDYFRRHLLFHEFTHCYTTFMPGDVPPVWYMEGVAEMFGTHRLKGDGTVEFRILPTKADEMGGWGRIESVRKDAAEGRSLTIRGVYELPHDAFFKPQAYAWSWALCQFLDTHPRYGERFRKLGTHLTDGEFGKTFHVEFSPDERDLSTEWTLFQHQVQPGYDLEAAAIDFQKGTPLKDQRQVEIAADRGWQDVGVRVTKGMEIEIAATGRFTLANEPKPWISEPQGISVRYFQRNPLGRLLACVDADPKSEAADADVTHMLQTISVGKSATILAPANGRLLFRVNDAWDSLADNEGSIKITLQRQ